MYICVYILLLASCVVRLGTVSTRSLMESWCTGSWSRTTFVAPCTGSRILLEQCEVAYPLVINMCHHRKHERRPLFCYIHSTIWPVVNPRGLMVPQFQWQLKAFLFKSTWNSLDLAELSCRPKWVCEGSYFISSGAQGPTRFANAQDREEVYNYMWWGLDPSTRMNNWSITTGAPHSFLSMRTFLTSAIPQ